MAAVSKNLTKDDLGCVVEALTPLKHKWEVIGLQIGVRSHVLESFKLEHSRNPGPCLLAVLKEHLSKIDPQPCWEGFVKALRSESVGETAFAEALRLKFCPNEPLSDVQSPECSTSDDVTSPVSTSASEQNQFPFPFLHLKLPAEMSEDARETLYGRLSTEHREMQWKFQRLVTTTRNGVAEKGITPEQLSDEICCQSYESQFEKDSKKLLSDSQEEIRKSKSINDAFFLMRNHYSFFNYELIEKIIMIFDLDRSHLSAFEEELQRFCERRVHEFPAKAYGTAMSTDSKLSIVLDSEFNKYTMNSLRSFRHRLGKIFKVSSAVIRLIEVFEGSIKIVFAISSSLVDQILPLSEEQEKSLRDEGVKRFEFTHHPNSFMVKNPLEAGINTDIHNLAAEFGEECETASLPDVPLDPNLVCPMCGLPFRIGQIQKFKTHLRNCKGASSSDSSHPQNAERPLADSHRQSGYHSKHPDSGFMSGMHSHEYSSPHKHPDSGFMSGMHSQNVSAEVDSHTHKSTK